MGALLYGVPFVAQGYMKSIKAKLAETNPDRVTAFEKGAAAYAKKIVASFGDFEFVSCNTISPIVQVLMQ